MMMTVLEKSVYIVGDCARRVVYIKSALEIHATTICMF